MTRHWILIGVGVVITIAGVGCSAKNTSTPQRAPVAASVHENTVEGVNALMRTNPAPGQSAVIEGVVADVAPKRHLVTLIDKAEYDQCKETTCAALYLPVRWRGKLPSLKATVKVQGKVGEENGKRIFLAKALHTLSGASVKASHETP